MSLINEALRKAQDQQIQGKRMFEGADTGTEPAYGNDRNHRHGLLLGLGIGIGIIILLALFAGLVWLILSDKEAPTNSKLADATGPAPSTELHAETSQESDSARVSAVATSEEPEVLAEPDARITEWVETAHITGLRITSDSSKIILNNQAFIPGEVVNAEFKLKILSIQADKLTFIDSNNVEYDKYL